MEFKKCKFYPNAVIYSNKEEYKLIRSACGPNYNYFSGKNEVVCSNVGMIVKCSEGHSMTYLTSELEWFSGKAAVRCRLCGHYTFVRDADLICLADSGCCKKHFLKT